MANQKVTELDELTSLQTGDTFHVVDVSDTTDGVGGTSKRSLLSTISTYLASLAETLTNKILTSPVINTGLSGTAKATGAEIDTGTVDTKFVTPKAVADSGVAKLAGSQTFTGAKTFTTGLLKAVDVTSGSGVSTFPTSTGTLRQLASRVLSATTYTTNTGTSLNCDTQDMFIVTAQAGDLKFNNPAGTPTDGQKLIITVASSTTAARALTWDTGFGATTTALPTTTVATTVTLSIGFIWSASKSLWQCVAVA
jgi:hypothetical protein